MYVVDKALGIMCTLYKVLGVTCTLYKVLARYHMYMVQQNSLWYLPAFSQPSSTWYSMRSFLPLLLLASPLLPSTEPVTRLRDTQVNYTIVLYYILGEYCTVHTPSTVRTHT